MKNYDFSSDEWRVLFKIEDLLAKRDNTRRIDIWGDKIKNSEGMKSIDDLSTILQELKKEGVIKCKKRQQLGIHWRLVNITGGGKHSTAFSIYQLLYSQH